MRIQSLELIAFGPFTDTTIGLEGGQHGVHLVYGPNEAGKSSILRALQQMLFGFESRSTDGFLHPNPKLRVGATLLDSRETPFSFVRRKGNKNTLRGSDDKTAISENKLQELLGNVSKDVFKLMFGIDHASLEAGGREMLEGKSEVSQLLFAAGSGIADLRNIQQTLQEDLDALFKPSGSNPQINRSLKEYRENQQALKATLLSREEWQRHDSALAEAVVGKQSVEQELQEKRIQHSRLDRIRQALPAISELRNLQDELAAYRDVVLLREDFGQERRTILENLRSAQRQKADALELLEEIERELPELEMPTAILAQVEAIDRLYLGLGEHRKAMLDRSGLQVAFSQHLNDAKALLRDLRPDLELVDVEQLRLTRAGRERIRKLGGDHASRQSAVEQTRKELEQCRQKIQELAGRIADLDAASDDAPLDAEALKQVLQRAQQAGDLEHQRDAAATSLNTLQTQAEVELKKLPGWTGDLETLEQLAIPAGETLDRFERELDEAEKGIDNIREKIESVEASLADLDVQIARLQLEQEVPTESDLQQARQQRDAGWQVIRSTWDTRPIVSDDADAFVLSMSAENLPDAFETATQNADEIADRLRREAKRVATLARLSADRDQHQQRLPDLREALVAGENEHAKILTEWDALWVNLGIQPLPPREMRQWLRRQESLGRQSAEIRNQQRVVDDLEGQIAAHRGEIIVQLQSVGDAEVSPEEPLASLINRGTRVVEKSENMLRERQTLIEAETQAQAMLPALEVAHTQACAQMTEWQVEWGLAIEPLGILQDSTPAEVNSQVDAIVELFQKYDKAQELLTRIADIDADAKNFCDEVAELATQVAVDLVELPVEQAASQLNMRLQETQRRSDRRTQLLEAQTRAREKKKSATHDMEELHARLADLCHEAGCETADELPNAEESSTRRTLLESRVSARRADVLHLSGGVSLTEFIDQALSVDADALPHELSQLDEEIADLVKKNDTLVAAIASEQKDLAAMDGSALAAEAAERSQSILAQIANDAERYAHLRLAQLVLQKGMERYRERHQGPVLQRASGLFRDLTLESFAGLDVDFSEKTGEPELVGVRPSANGKGPTVGLDGMSEGTADQLYLALRIASLEEYLDNHDPLPFIVDDVLVDFDNARSVAALKALAELSMRTQVIFFTHHEHLVELAEANLAPDTLFVHHLNV